MTLDCQERRDQIEIGKENQESHQWRNFEEKFLIDCMVVGEITILCLGRLLFSPEHSASKDIQGTIQ